MPLKPRLQIDLSLLREASNPKFYPLFFNTSRFLVMVGGAGSGKSHFAAQKILVRLVSERGPHRFVVARKVQRTLRASCFRLLNDYVARWGWAKYFNVNKSDLDMTFLPTGAQIMFRGMDDPEKLKSVESPTGFWLEESTEFDDDDLEQVNLRLRGEMPNYKQIMLTFNPVSINHWLKTRFFDGVPSGRVTTMRTTYLDNLFIDAEYRAELEDLRLRNPSWWTIYGRGEWGVMEGLIYQQPDMSPWPASFDETFYGLDFGYNNPTVLIRADMKDGDPYLTEDLYETGLTNADLIARLRDIVIKRTLPIYADAAEPGRIAEICKAGFNCLPADKGAGSVHAGISFCQGLHLHSKPSNSNLNAELSSYVWAKDKNGKTLDEPVKFKDHACDSFRMALWSHIAKRERVPVPFSRKLIGV
jgi:phage terminase large subunit